MQYEGYGAFTRYFLFYLRPFGNLLLHHAGRLGVEWQLAPVFACYLANIALLARYLERLTARTAAWPAYVLFAAHDLREPGVLLGHQDGPAGGLRADVFPGRGARLAQLCRDRSARISAADDGAGVAIDPVQGELLRRPRPVLGRAMGAIPSSSRWPSSPSSAGGASARYSLSLFRARCLHLRHCCRTRCCRIIFTITTRHLDFCSQLHPWCSSTASYCADCRRMRRRPRSHSSRTERWSMSKRRTFGAMRAGFARRSKTDGGSCERCGRSAGRRARASRFLSQG